MDQRNEQEQLGSRGSEGSLGSLGLRGLSDDAEGKPWPWEVIINMPWSAKTSVTRPLTDLMVCQFNIEDCFRRVIQMIDQEWFVERELYNIGRLLFGHDGGKKMFSIIGWFKLYDRVDKQYVSQINYTYGLGCEKPKHV